VKAPSRYPKSSDWMRFFRDRRAVDGDEPPLSPAQAMRILGEHLFACPGCPTDEHGNGHLDRSLDHGNGPRHDRILTDKADRKVLCQVGSSWPWS
jgi:hypothetical protein